MRRFQHIAGGGQNPVRLLPANPHHQQAHHGRVGRVKRAAARPRQRARGQDHEELLLLGRQDYQKGRHHHVRCKWLCGRREYRGEPEFEHHHVGSRRWQHSRDVARRSKMGDLRSRQGGTLAAVARNANGSNNMTSAFKFELNIGRLAIVCTAATIAWSAPAGAQTQYTASWTSLDTHNPAPEWFQDAKFGIYYHWGAWCVAAYGSEWYPRNMYNKGSGEYNNQMSKYGDPFSAWPYDKFLTGANDKSGKFTQFAPKLKSDGGVWDPDEWAQMFADAGAKYAGPVAEHHDGFSMWDSKVNE